MLSMKIKKKYKKYKNMAKKTDLWNLNAAELHLEYGHMLKNWYKNVRNVRNEENIGNKRLNFLTQNFVFLKSQIVRGNGRLA
ncbi:hypothetical protein DPMN_156697 [Dreissena polymorpha]|uniref:Uncharacterized protein n=1 Tax=Dreissena polymorpha TaxID=45954 RepID=A0A9D4JB22_DREPO|nr:hypothetical protein DPMN_156697 [Dreissena polymorpha]